MKWLEPHFTEAEMAPVEIATRIHHSYLVADAKLQQILSPVESRIIRLDFGGLENVRMAGGAVILVKPDVVNRDPEPGKWSDMIRVRDTLRIEHKGIKIVPSLPYLEPGIATLVNYIVGVGVAPRANQLIYTPTGKTQERPFATRVEVPTVTVEPVFVDEEKIILDYHIDFDFTVSLKPNGWQAEAALNGS